MLDVWAVLMNIDVVWHTANNVEIKLGVVLFDINCTESKNFQCCSQLFVRLLFLRYVQVATIITYIVLQTFLFTQTARFVSTDLLTDKAITIILYPLLHNVMHDGVISITHYPK